MKVQGIGRALLTGALLAVPVVSLAGTTARAEPGRETAELAHKVRHELVMLPYYGVFDNLTFSVEDGVVTLGGQVTRPVLRSDAGKAVKRLEGVQEVVNNIEVLPLSRFDDDIRLAAAYSVYGYPALQRYGLGANPSIRIIVRNGEVVLEGVVSNGMDRNLAYIRANGVSGVFKVTNNLRVETGNS